MTSGAQHERQLIAAFILPERRERYLEFLSKPKLRKKIIANLSHFRHLDPRYLVSIPSRQQHPKDLDHLLRSMGAPNLCYALSENSEIDGREIPLFDALHAVVGYDMGTFLSCMPGELAYFEDEDQRWILRAKNKG
jgi:hypothetical protein